MIDPVALAQDLIRCPSVTPADAGALGVLDSALKGLGFTTHRLTFGEPPDGPIDNLFAVRGTGGRHLAFAGHTDVVPVGDGWTHQPFAGTIDGGLLVGRGAADMKGAIAAFVAAVSRRHPDGTISFIITGDEEGPATWGTAALLDWMDAHGHKPDACLVGEPTSASRLGDMLKVGRRGSLNAWLAVAGKQGHVAYPARADNPIPRLIRLLAKLQDRVLDSGSAFFDASNLEVTDIAVGNPATNIIPSEARARLNIRFNDLHKGADLKAWIERLAAEEGATALVRISGESFVTPPGDLIDTVAAAIRDVTGLDPDRSTTGGTSDARFIRRMCPVVEFGLPGATMHQVDEAVSVADIERLADIYERVVARFFGD